MNLRDFARRIYALSGNVEENAPKVVRKTALAVDQTIVLATPVDTGRARSNWQVSAGRGIASMREAYQEGSGASTGAQNAQAAIEQGKIAIAAAPDGQEIHITNNLPYIGKLNEGYSAQAPANFVEEAVHNGIKTVHASRLLTQDGT